MGLFGGSSKSSSTSSTLNQDNRSVADAQAQSATAGGQNAKDQGVIQPIALQATGKGSSIGATINITNTDHGAVESAFDFADANAQSAALSVKAALGVAEGIFNKSTDAVDKAYEEAKGGATVVQNLAIGAILAAVAVVYFITNKGKHA